MPSSRHHCETCLFGNLEAATPVLARAEQYVATESLYAADDETRNRKLKEFEQAMSPLGLGEERVSAARACGRAMLEGSCMWSDGEPDQGLTVHLSREFIDSLSAEDDGLIDVVAGLAGGLKEVAPQVMTNELLDQAHQAAQENQLHKEE